MNLKHKIETNKPATQDSIYTKLEIFICSIKGKTVIPLEERAGPVWGGPEDMHSAGNFLHSDMF